MFKTKVKHLIEKLFDHAKLDAAVDQMGKKFIESSLPPALTSKEKEASVHGSGEFWDTENEVIEGAIELEPDTQIKFIRYGVVRIVAEEDEIRLYHSLENSYDPNQEVEPHYIEIDSQHVEAVEYLIKTYPSYISIEQLPLETIEQKVKNHDFDNTITFNQQNFNFFIPCLQLDIANLLYDKGLLTIIQTDIDSDSS